MIYCVGPYSCYLLNMCSAYSIHIFAFMCLWCTENIILWHCQFGLRVIYHVLHFKLQTPAAKYLFSLSLWGMHMPNTVFAKWKKMWKLVFVNKYLSNFCDQRNVVFKWCSFLGVLYFRVINLLIFIFLISFIVLLWSGDNHFGGESVARY